MRASLTHVGSVEGRRGYLVVRRYFGLGFCIWFLALVSGREDAGSREDVNVLKSCNGDPVEEEGMCWADWADGIEEGGMVEIGDGVDGEEEGFWGWIGGGVGGSKCWMIRGWRDNEKPLAWFEFGEGGDA